MPGYGEEAALMKVLIVTARGLQLSAIGCYGNRWIETPALDQLASQSVVFDQHYADRADSGGARLSWRTGRYVFPGLAESLGPRSPAASDLLDTLRGADIFTCLIVDTSHPVPPEFASGWAKVESIEAGEDETGLERVIQAAQKRLNRLAQRESWLLWIDLATVLPPWAIPEEYLAPYFSAEEGEEQEDAEEEPEEVKEDPVEALEPLAEVAPGPIDPTDDTLFLRLQSSYAASVSYLDAGIGQLLETVDEMADGDEVLVLVTSDCGQALGEHGVVGPVRPWLHEEIIHLPLIFRLPTGAEAGRRVPALTQTVDLAPTLAAAFALALPGAHGLNLLPLARGEIEQVRDYACSGLEIGGTIEWALRTPEWSFHLPLSSAEGAVSGPRLYVKPDDRCEVNDVLQHHFEQSEHFEQTLRAFVAATRQDGPLQSPVLHEVETASGSEGP
jgi:arylsulfatase A-like enzyme